MLELQARIERLEREGGRQAAPFSKGKQKAVPKKPGRRQGQGPFRYRTRPDPSEITEPAVFAPTTSTRTPTGAVQSGSEAR